jgi:tetratricopeptide (TPR) repeat protein
MTDRGRIYIMLGEPRDIQRFEGMSQVYPTEVWFYQGMTDLGLPPAFNLVFYQEGAVGDYRLYSPLADGPQALMTTYTGDPVDYLAAYETLRELVPDLSEVSLSLIPGESSTRLGRPSLSSDLLINKIETTPQRAVKDQYARKFLEYKDIVEVEYSANYIENDALVKVTRDPSGIYFVQYAIEPERLSVNAQEDRYYTTLILNGTVADEENGAMVYQFEKTIPLQFDGEQIQQISRRPISLRDMFPLIPGKYRLSVLIKNEVSKEFTSLERALFIPTGEEALQMTSLLLGYGMEEDVPEHDRLRPFQAGRYRPYFQANRVFTRADDLVLAFQVTSLDRPFRDRAEIRYTLFKEGEEFHGFSRRLADYADLPHIVESLSLKDFPPAHYRIRVALWDEEKEILAETEEFDITFAARLPRPWIHSKLLAGTGHPDYAYTIGLQLHNQGRIDQARAQLTRAHAAEPSNLRYALALARTYLVLKDSTRIPPLLAPFMEGSTELPYEMYITLGSAWLNLGDPARARDIFEQGIQRHGVNTLMLNFLGECHFHLSQWADARAVWERSLEINAQQPAVRKRLEALKEKR